MTVRKRLVLLVHIWGTTAWVQWSVTRTPLPLLVHHLEVRGESSQRWSSASGGLSPVRLGRVIDRWARLGPWQPRCIVKALVLHALLCEQGVAAAVVVGLPSKARDHRAHAWVECKGADVGPPPGRMGHAELARYGRAAAKSPAGQPADGGERNGALGKRAHSPASAEALAWFEHDETLTASEGVGRTRHRLHAKAATTLLRWQTVAREQFDKAKGFVHP